MHIYILQIDWLMISNTLYIESLSIIEQMKIIGLGSLSIILLTAFFIGLVFSLQIVKEFLYLNALHLIGSVLATAFLRELSPVLTAVILIGNIGSYFTSELATMIVTEQIDVLYTLDINPVYYLILPRVLAFTVIIPILNCISFITSLMSSIFICFTFYNIDPQVFLSSVFNNLCILDIYNSSFKTIIFGFFISLISCFWGMFTKGGAKGVGVSTTLSVVTSLVSIFILDFILSYYMFNMSKSSLSI
uniref:ABC transporter permease n=1 Tax=Bornetia secundiflora TaxID=2575637 RepID=A0A4D6WT78_9FLOR|nr:hypothetical protein [Bornetia secundiflora]